MKKILTFILFISMLVCQPIICTATADTSDDASQNVTADASTDSDDNASSDSDYDWPQGPSVDAEAAIVMDVNSGAVLYEKNADEKHYPASITKILTTLLCLENCSMDEMVTFSHNAVYNLDVGSSNIGIQEGEQLTMEQCLYAIMLASANECSSAVAEHIGGSVDEFANMMNKKAISLGCTNSHFVNANGLHNDSHYTTARDMALISRAAMQIPEFRTIVSTKRYTIPPTNKHKDDNVFMNHHQMLVGNKYPQFYYDYCIGGKTGYTTVAGNTLVTFAEKDGITLLTVVMRAKAPDYKDNEYTDSTAMFDFVFDNFTSYDIANTASSIAESTDSPLFSKYNRIFDTENSPITFDSSAKVLLPNDVDLNQAERTIELYDTAKTEDDKNIIGSVTYTFGGKTVGLTNILFNPTSDEELTLKSPSEEFAKNIVQTVNRHNLKPLIMTVIFIVLFIIGILYYLFARNTRKNTTTLHF
ncbi:MAG: D-alanyl-D-alanine carboxypeptidase [Lachnospiraceae bacterium]|nr:D-alanyl-D-alanine carboxypeptidase [Lachnospiraceae bacterium]